MGTSRFFPDPEPREKFQAEGPQVPSDLFKASFIKKAPAENVFPPKGLWNTSPRPPPLPLLKPTETTSLFLFSLIVYLFV